MGDIEVDGGVKADWTIAQCCDAGANCFIAGSGMFAYPTLKEGCDALRAVARRPRPGTSWPSPTKRTRGRPNWVPARSTLKRNLKKGFSPPPGGGAFKKKKKKKKKK